MLEVVDEWIPQKLNEKDLDQLVQLLMDDSNHTRKWVLRGHRPID